MDKFLKSVLDLLFGTKRKVRNYEKANPGDKILVADGSKGIMTTGDQDIVRGFAWLVSKRAVLMLSETKIICGKWIIPLNEIESAQLLRIHTPLSSAQVLKIRTKDGKNYQFGMQTNPEWTAQTALPLTLEETKMKHSVFSIIIRLLALAYLIYFFYTEYWETGIE